MPRSAQNYRRRNKEVFERMKRECGCSVDVAHIVAKANGGANNRKNYIPMPHNINQALGHRRDDIMYAYVGAERTREAVLISQKLRGSKETVDNAEQLRQDAEEDLKKLLKECGLNITLPPRSGRVMPNAYVHVEGARGGGGEDMVENTVEKCLEKAREDPKYFLKIVEAWNQLKY